MNKFLKKILIINWLTPPLTCPNIQQKQLDLKISINWNYSALRINSGKQIVPDSTFMA